jgi:hypothetical protein
MDGQPPSRRSSLNIDEARNPPKYYTSLYNDDITEGFRNFDDPAHLEYFNSAVLSARSKNFCIDFGDNEAWCAFDLNAPAISKLVKSPVSGHSVYKPNPLFDTVFNSDLLL